MSRSLICILMGVLLLAGCANKQERETIVTDRIRVDWDRIYSPSFYNPHKKNE